MAQPVFINPIEQAQSALDALMGGDVKGAGRAIVSPASQSPEELRTIAQKYIGDDPGPLGGIVDMVSNPIFLAGLVLTSTYPIATADRMLNFGGKIASYARKHSPVMRWLNDFTKTFGEELGAWMDATVARNHDAKRFALLGYDQAIERFKKSGGVWEKSTPYRIAAHLDGLHKPNHTLWKKLKEAAPDRFGTKRVLINQLKLTPQERALAEEFRGAMNTQFEMVKHEVGEDRIKKGLDRLGLRGPGREIDNYFPRVNLISKERAREQFQEWMATFAGDAQASHAVRRMTGKGFERQTSRRLARRYDMTIPSPEHLKEAGLWNAQLEAAYPLVESSIAAQTGAPAVRYSMNSVSSLEHYVRSMASTYAWEAPLTSYGGKKVLSPAEYVRQEIPIMAQQGASGRMKATLLKETYIPLLSGQHTWEQGLDSMRWAATKEWAADLVGHMPIPDKTKEALIKPLLMPKTGSSMRFSSQATKLLYGNTLGLNVVSPAKNLLQNIITTYPTIGTKYLAEGIDETMAGFKRYMTYIKNGEHPIAARNRAWPNFSTADIDIGQKQAGSALLDIASDGEMGIKGIGKFNEITDAVQEKMLTMFTASERFNRMVAYHGARAKALKELPGKRIMDPFLEQEVLVPKSGAVLNNAADRFASEVTKMTQYGGGPLNTPAGLLTGTFRHPLLRMYMQFPARTLQFAAGPATMMGGGGKRNFGGLGRMMLGSSAAYYAGKTLLGTDLSPSLMFGAMPALGDEGSPFGVWPLVSPALQLAGNTAQGIASGDPKHFQESLPLLLPGGVQLARMSTLWEPAAKAFGRPYADYENRTEDGRIPIYTANGSLQGTYSPIQLWARAVGIGDMYGPQEIAAMQVLVKNRDRIRGYRRDYLEKLILHNNPGAATAINKEYQQAFPGFGPIQIKESDINALQLRMEVPRLERILETLPKELRPAFNQLVAVSFGNKASEFMGIDPALLTDPATPTARSRNPQRTKFNRQIQKPPGRPGQGTDLVREAGKQRRDEILGGALQPFQGGY